jgi:hypothetical protein
MATRLDIMVTLYCSEDHIFSAGDKWADADYINRLNPAESTGVTIFPIDQTRPAAKPSELVQGSYTSVGKSISRFQTTVSCKWTINFLIGFNDPDQNVRCGDQAHIFINPLHIDVPAYVTGFETRSYKDILAQGLNDITDLDHMFPLSLVIFHEVRNI